MTNIRIGAFGRFAWLAATLMLAGGIARGELCSAAGEQLACDVDPSADTFIAAGENRARNYGQSTELGEDSDPRTIAYLKFDLREVRARVQEATLQLFFTNSTASDPPDCGSVYPVRDSSWIEGDSIGDADSPAPELGLRWIDVDSNDDGAVDVSERSRYAPVVTQPVARIERCPRNDSFTILVTSAFQDGPGIYTLAITTNDRDEVRFASREHPNMAAHPVLHLHLRLAGSCGDGNPDAGEACDDGNTADGDGCDSNCTPTGCGNGIRAGAEQCDDGNANEADCCSNTCRQNGDIAGCACGDAKIDPGEACDAGGESPACDSDCSLVTCGDGHRNTTVGETCDDANLADGDGCSHDCKRECCARQNEGGCDDAVCLDCVRQLDSFCAVTLWDDRCVALAASNCAAACLCGGCHDDHDVICSVQPIADTYIEGPNAEGQTDPTCEVNNCATCGQVTWDHGGRDRVDVDANPIGLAYFKFDLSALTRPIVSASLKLYATNPSVDGGVDGPGDGGSVYKLADPSWVEGHCDGLDGKCACNPGDGSCACDTDGSCQTRCGMCRETQCDPFADIVACADLQPCPAVDARGPLTFYSVDRNHDGILDPGESPYLPDFSRDFVSAVGKVPLGPNTIDVSRAFVRSAPYAIVSLVIGRTGTVNGSTYTSREYLDPARHPTLELKLGCKSNDDCPAKKCCTPLTCEQGECVERFLDECECCSTNEDCVDDDPCTKDECGTLAEGCRHSASLPGLPAETCQLTPQPAPEVCTQGQRFIKKVDKLKAAVRQDLIRVCTDVVSEKRRKKVFRAALRKLEGGRRRIAKAIDLGSTNAGKISQECANALADGVDKAIKALRDALPRPSCENVDLVTSAATNSSRGRRKERRPAEGRLG